MRLRSTKKVPSTGHTVAAILLIASQVGSADPLKDQLDQLEEVILEQMDDCARQHYKTHNKQNSLLTSILNWTRDTPPAPCGKAGLELYSQKIMEIASGVDPSQPDQQYREILNNLTKRLRLFETRVGIQDAREAESAALYKTLSTQDATTTTAGAPPEGHAVLKGYTAISGK